MEIVLIRWFDSAISHSTSVYTPAEALQEGPIVMETVGWLINETSEPYGGSYTLADSKHDEDWRGLQVIPKANVIEITQLDRRE